MKSKALGVSQGPELAVFFLVLKGKCCPNPAIRAHPIRSLLPQLPIEQPRHNPSPAALHQLLPLPTLTPSPGRPPGVTLSSQPYSFICPAPPLCWAQGTVVTLSQLLPLGPSRHRQIALSPLISRLMLSFSEEALIAWKMLSLLCPEQL